MMAPIFSLQVYVKMSNFSLVYSILFELISSGICFWDIFRNFSAKYAVLSQYSRLKMD